MFFLLNFLFNKPERFIADSLTLPVLERLKEATFHILDNKKFYFYSYLTPLNFKNYYQEITIQEGKQSFTENKKNIFLCMRDRTGNVYDFNSLMYVLLHEISHVINDELHHTQKFKNIFSELLKHAENLGYYNSNIPFESKYCN